MRRWTLPRESVSSKLVDEHVQQEELRCVEEVALPHEHVEEEEEDYYLVLRYD